jgi:lysozyme
MIPDLAITLAKHFEGFSPVPYLCPAGFWTIAYGRLCDQDHPAVDQQTGEQYLIEDMQSAYTAAIRFCPVLLNASEPRLAAIVDFTFNLGAGRLQTSTLRRRVNEQNWDEAAYELKRWVWGGGKKLPGLVKRREIEALWMMLG